MQFDNDYKKINMRKIYHVCTLFGILTIFRNEKSAYMVYFSHIYLFIVIKLYISTFPCFDKCLLISFPCLSARLIFDYYIKNNILLHLFYYIYIAKF